jgi:hypothetical protein
MARYRLLERGVLDTQDGTVIPDLSHPRWRDYIQWVTAGNVADPVVVVPHVVTPAEQAALDEMAAREAIRETLRLDTAIQALRTRTPAQVDSWIDTNVTDLPSARAVLKILARILALLARERIGG